MEETSATERVENISKAKETPMGQVWFIVLATMVATSAVMFGWHAAAMNIAAREDQKESDVVRARITKLLEYKNILETEGKVAAEELLKNNPAQ